MRPLESLDLLTLIPHRAELCLLAREFKDTYRRGEPFPHVVIDNFLPPAVADALERDFPSPGEKIWYHHDEGVQSKLAANTDFRLPALYRNVLYACNTAGFLRFLEALTCIDRILPDPFFLGAGLHQTVVGGRVGIHLDFNTHEYYGWYRRLNVLIYLNREWREEYGGALELWGDPSGKCVRKILPLMNRCVIFETTDRSYHGHPEPVRGSPERTRKSLALYYYTQDRPYYTQDRPGQAVRHQKRETVWLERA